MDVDNASMDTEKKAPQGLNQAAVGLLNSHIALLVIEIDEAKQFYWRCFIRLAILTVSCVLFFMLFSIGIVAYFWDTDRMIAILSLLAVCLLMMLFASMSLISLKKRTTLFSASKEEFKKDQAVFYD